jgi:SAM-dependent methyltransferase
MTESPNAAQVEFWNGPGGARWVREQEELDRSLAPFAEALFARAALEGGERVVDVGCGCGVTSLAASALVGPAGAVLGVDVSAPMLARAMERAAGLTNVSFALSDATTYGFAGPFDAVISRFGVMFFANPVAAFANLRGALRPGGRFAFIAWRSVAENPWVRIPAEAASAHVPSPPRPGPDDPGPFSFGARPRGERILAEAGFSNVEIAPFDADVVLSGSGLEQAVVFAMTTGPTARMLVDVTDDVRKRVRGALLEALRPHVSAGRVALQGATWLVSAVSEKPAGPVAR